MKRTHEHRKIAVALTLAVGLSLVLTGCKSEPEASAPTPSPVASCSTATSTAIDATQSVEAAVAAAYSEFLVGLTAICSGEWVKAATVPGKPTLADLTEDEQRGLNERIRALAPESFALVDWTGRETPDEEVYFVDFTIFAVTDLDRGPGYSDLNIEITVDPHQISVSGDQATVPWAAISVIDIDSGAAVSTGRGSFGRGDVTFGLRDGRWLLLADRYVHGS